MNADTPPSELAALLQNERQNHESRSELARAIGVSEGTLRRAEAGKPLATDSLNRIAEFFGLSYVTIYEMQGVFPHQNTRPVNNPYGAAIMEAIAVLPLDIQAGAAQEVLRTLQLLHTAYDSGRKPAP